MISRGKSEYKTGDSLTFISENERKKQVEKVSFISRRGLTMGSGQVAFTEKS